MLLSRPPRSVDVTSSLTVALVGISVFRWLFPTAGYHDFVQYYAGGLLLLGGKDPYDIDQMVAMQSQLGRESAMMWAPYWLLLLLWPLLLLPYKAAGIAWIYLKAPLLCLVCHLSWRLITGERRWLIPLLLGMAMVVPLLQDLSTGQIGLLLALGVTALTVGLIEGHAGWFALGVVAMSVKPHLFVIFAIWSAFYVARSAQWKLAGTALVTLLAVICAASVLFHQTPVHWLNAILFPAKHPSIPTTSSWLPGTLPGWLQSVAPDAPFVLPLVRLIPLIAGVGTAFVFVRQKCLPRYSQFFVALGWSVFLSPYGWAFDYLVLTPVFMFLVSRGGPLLIAWTLLVQLAAAVFLWTKTLTFYHQYFWYPGALALFATLVDRRVRYWGEADCSSWRTQ